MDFTKLKQGNIVLLEVVDLHTNSGWSESKEKALQESEVICIVAGIFIGLSKDKELCISIMVSEEDKTPNSRLYIPKSAVRKLTILR